MRSMLVPLVILAFGAATASGQSDAIDFSPIAWEQILSTMSDVETAEVVALLWGYASSLIQVMAVAVGQTDGQARMELEQFVEDWLEAKIGSIEIESDTAQEVATVLKEFVVKALERAPPTLPQVSNGEYDSG